MISPTVGRVVWFYPEAEESGDDRPWPGFVCKVFSDTMINVAGFNAWGTTFSQHSCQLIQGDESPTGPHCRWMPYQKGQAAKTEALEEKLKSV